MELEETVREAVKVFGLRGCHVFRVADRTQVYIHFLNKNEKYEQIEIVPEEVDERTGNLSVEALRDEIARKLESGDTKLISES